MSSTIEISPTLQETSLNDGSKQPLTVREKIVNLFQELETTRDEQRRVNGELEKEIQSRIDVRRKSKRNQISFFIFFVKRLKATRHIFVDKFNWSKLI